MGPKRTRGSQPRTAQPAAHPSSEPHPALHDLLVTAQAGPWRTHLIQHLYPPERAALHQTCTALRDAVLADAPALAIVMPLQLAAIQATRRALQRRPQQPTDITLDTRQSDVSIGTALSMLAGSTTVRSLTIRPYHTATADIAADIAAIPVAFPNLTSLTFTWRPPDALTALTATALPHLTTLVLNIDISDLTDEQQEADQVEGVLHDFWQQLTLLHISHKGWPGPQYNLPQPFLPAATTAHHLTQLSLPFFELTDMDVCTLLECAPKLTELVVWSINLEEDYRSSLCGWRKVTCSKRVWMGEGTEWKLPRSHDGHLEVVLDGGLGKCLVMRQGCTAKLRARYHTRYQGLKLDPGAIRDLEVRSYMEDAQEEPDELRALLGFLRDVFVDYDGMQLTLKNVAMSGEMIAEDGVLSMLPARARARVWGQWNNAQPEVYRNLLSRFPGEVPEVCFFLGEGRLSYAVIEQILLGCPKDRTEDRPLEVLFYDHDGGLDFIYRLAADMKESGLYPHVAVATVS